VGFPARLLRVRRRCAPESSSVVIADSTNDSIVLAARCKMRTYSTSAQSPRLARSASYAWRKHPCKCGGCVETAPGPERATTGGRYSLDFALKVAIDKYLVLARACGDAATRRDALAAEMFN
jgi:hypothetical protein